MSTYVYAECLDHDPPLRSAGEVSQHRDDEHVATAARLVGERPLTRDYESAPRVGRPGFLEANARAFLLDHPRCAVGLVTEYGERLPLPAPDGATTTPGLD